MQQYRPHYQWCQLLKEFVFFTWDPKKLEKFVFRLKLTSRLTLISSLTKVTIQEQFIFADFTVDKRNDSSDAAWLAVSKRRFPSSPSHAPRSCAVPSSCQLCTCVRAFVKLLSAVTQEKAALAKPPPSKRTMFSARLMNWTDSAACLTAQGWMPRRVWFSSRPLEYAPIKPGHEVKTNRATHILKDINFRSFWKRA